ncbi:hypothetical protein O181_089729 [Austropuccinia psidii MF-1]|uniref:Uncharacterized protein n=1 Tax=Austropuccinia psidii MF-1 TaxID=1389203 RepID=A0A9Q3IU68_9BASI|nr:hypothetical protein [Austropuccinia psidii MF-1]
MYVVHTLFDLERFRNFSNDVLDPAEKVAEFGWDKRCKAKTLSLIDLVFPVQSCFSRLWKLVPMQLIALHITWLLSRLPKYAQTQDCFAQVGGSLVDACVVYSVSPGIDGRDGGADDIVRKTEELRIK